MVVRLRLFGVLETYFGGSRLEVELPTGATLRDLLVLIDARWGRELPSQFWNADEKRFQRSVLIMSQGADLYDYDIPLSDQQELMFLIPASGG
jgi:molybdopterin converting factor small subunit